MQDQINYSCGVKFGRLMFSCVNFSAVSLSPLIENVTVCSFRIGRGVWGETGAGARQEPGREYTTRKEQKHYSDPNRTRVTASSL